jgi:SAM-dependent methyltransferase
MRRRTKLAVVAGGATATVAGSALALARFRGRGPEAAAPAEDADFTVYAPGGPYGFLFNGPVGWASTKYMPILNAGVYGAVAEILDLQPDDELLDIGCGPGAFLAAKTRHARRVVGLDASPVMLRDARRRLADRLAEGTAQLVLGSAAALPFGDGEFSAITAIEAPANPAEVFRVLRPGGRFVFVDPMPRKTSSEPTVAWGLRRRGESDYRRMTEGAGFTDLTFRYRGGRLGGELLGSCRKPAAS